MARNLGRAWVRCVYGISRAYRTYHSPIPKMIAPEKQKDADRKIKHWLENERRVVSLIGEGDMLCSATPRHYP